MMKTGMPGMVKGMISMNFLAVEEILISIDGLIKKLYNKNERIRHTISRLERCTGTRENPHNHNVEIAAYMQVLRKNEKDIKNLTTIYGQIDNFKNCTQQTDQRLAKLIKETFPEYITPKAGEMTRSMPASGEELSISEQAARNANLLVIDGRPQINSGTDYQAYMAEMEKLTAMGKELENKDFSSYGINIDEILMNTNSTVLTASLVEGKAYKVIADGSAKQDGCITQTEYNYLVATVAGEAGGVSVSNAFGCASAFLNNLENYNSDKSLISLLNDACWKFDYREIKGYQQYLNVDTGELSDDPDKAVEIQNAKVAVDAALAGHRAFDSSVICWVGNGVYNKFSTTWEESSDFT